MVPLQADRLGGGAGMGRWVSQWGSIGSWAVGRCRVAVRGMKGRERKFRKIKYLHLSCLQQNDYQVMRLQKHDDNDMSKSIGKYELPIIIK